MAEGGSDYPSSVKRQRMNEVEKTHVAYRGINAMPYGGKPDTLRIGMQMKDFVVAPPQVDENEWIAYMVYHISDRLKNLWNLFLYFCLDESSLSRVTASRSIQYYGLPKTEVLSEIDEIYYSQEKDYCKIGPDDKTYLNTSLTSTQCAITTWPIFIEVMLSDFEKIKNDEKIMGKGENTIPESFRSDLVPFFTNAFSMFEHFYRKHYGDICSLGVLLHFNSLFSNIVALSDHYNIVKATEETLGTQLLSFYNQILAEEAQHVKAPA